jgi:aminopeptidase N
MRHQVRVATITIFFSILFLPPVYGQYLNKKSEFSKYDTLRGSLNEFRTNYDVLHYDIDVRLDIPKKSIDGEVSIKLMLIKNNHKIQLDLFSQFQIEQVWWNQTKVSIQKDSNYFYVNIPKSISDHSKNIVKIKYNGKPNIAVRAPWDGGFVWGKDSLGRDWIGMACEGHGASSWWPCKDHLSDEPDHGMDLKVSVPKGLDVAANGRLISKETKGSMDQFHWRVVNPINNYNINFTVGHFVNFKDTLNSEETHKTLDIDYWVLDYNMTKAKKQFEQVKPMLRIYEEVFGKYPFYEDGYKLIETPYLGMEHQSGIAYGNNYKKGYKGNINMTNGYTFDYIIIHESGHEWFGNNISIKDMADMWIHEGFTTYSESIFVEKMYGKKEALNYINSHKFAVTNKNPIQGEYGVNKEGEGEMYTKGSLFINTLRSVVDNDSLWFVLLKDFNKKFWHKTTDYDEVVAYFSNRVGPAVRPIFNQYVRRSEIPVLKTNPTKNIDGTTTLNLKFEQVTSDFEMPIFIEVDGIKKKINVNSIRPVSISVKDLDQVKVLEEKTYIIVD